MADYGNAFDEKNYDERMKELTEGGADGEDFAPEWEEVCESFDDMNLDENLLRGIYAYGFEKPSAIQKRGIVPMGKGLDVIQQAQSGTGKTATFCAGVLAAQRRQSCSGTQGSTRYGGGVRLPLYHFEKYRRLPPFGGELLG